MVLSMWLSADLQHVHHVLVYVRHFEIGFCLKPDRYHDKSKPFLHLVRLIKFAIPSAHNIKASSDLRLLRPCHTITF